MWWVNISSVLVSLQVKKSHSESHVPDPSDARYAHYVWLYNITNNVRSFRTLCVCPSSLVMVQRGEVSLQLRVMMMSSTLSQDLSVWHTHTEKYVLIQSKHKQSEQAGDCDSFSWLVLKHFKSYFDNQFILFVIFQVQKYSLLPAAKGEDILLFC